MRSGAASQPEGPRAGLVPDQAPPRPGPGSPLLASQPVLQPSPIERKCIRTFVFARLHGRAGAVTVKQKNLPDEINGVQRWLNCLMTMWPWASQPSSLELNILILS